MRRVLAIATGVALVALLSAAGGAVAEAMITGQQIKNGTVTSADIKNKTVTFKDLAKSARTPGANGVAGPAGEQGPRGFSAWEVIPPGVTVTGGFEVNTSTTGGVDDDIWQVTLPGVAPTPLSSARVNFAPKDGAEISDPDPTCTGTVANPTAPPGNVCIYLLAQQNASYVLGLRSEVAPRQAFRILWTPATRVGQDLVVNASWAYTAP